MRPAARAVVGAMAAAALTAGACRGDAQDEGGEGPTGPTAPVTAAEQVRSYPHDPQAFTQGLLWHDGALYESTGRYGQSTVRRVALETGTVQAQTALADRYFAEGLALHDGRLYQLTWQEGTGLIYEVGDLRQVATFPWEGEGWGLTSDGTALYASDGSNVIRVVDPNSFRVLRTIDVTDGAEYVHQLNELEWVKGELWANVWHSDRIARIDPATGRVVGWVDLAGLLPPDPSRDGEAVANGIAYDAATDRLFVTGKLWPRLFEIRLSGVAGGGASPAPSSAPAGGSAASAGGDSAGGAAAADSGSASGDSAAGGGAGG